MKKSSLSIIPLSLLLTVGLLLSSYCGLAAQSPSNQNGIIPIKSEPSESVDVVVQGALDWELQPLLAALADKREVQVAAWTFWRGRIGDKSVVVSRTEMGPINAVAATTIAVLHFRPKLIINQGTAGANDPALKVYDIVVGTAAVDYGAFYTPHADAGQGSELARHQPLAHELRLDGKETVQFKSFAGDPTAAQTALKTKYARGRVVPGIIGSAYQFNREIDRLLWVRQTFGTSSEDMESAFAAGAAQGFRTRFLAVRIISDSEFYAPELKREAGAYCAAFVVDVIRNLGR